MQELHFHVLGSLIEAMIKKKDNTVNQHSERIEDIQYKQQEEAQSKSEDLANQVHSKNLFQNKGTFRVYCRFGGSSLWPIQDPFIRAYYIDRIHRALMASDTNGLPRDVVVKLHYFTIKEKIISFRECDQLQLHNYGIYIFVDLAPHTIQKRKSLAFTEENNLSIGGPSLFT